MAAIIFSHPYMQVRLQNDFAPPIKEWELVLYILSLGLINETLANMKQAETWKVLVQKGLPTLGCGYYPETKMWTSLRWLDEEAMGRRTEDAQSAACILASCQTYE